MWPGDAIEAIDDRIADHRQRHKRQPRRGRQVLAAAVARGQLRADVVGEITGHEPTEQEVIALAQKTPSQTNPGPIYAPPADPSHSNGNGGIEMADAVVLLDYYGIKSVMTDTTTHPDQTGMPALQQYLTDGRKIIAWVNSAIIWTSGDQRTKADHFLVVTGIDTNKEIVHLNDPGADHSDEQVSITTFTTAWQTGADSIVVTNAPS